MKKLSLLNPSLGNKERTFLAANLAAMLKAGLTLNESLSLLAEQSRRPQRRLLMDIATQVESGQGFADALSRYPHAFPEIFRHLVKAGEISGNLTENLFELASYLKKQNETRDKIRSAMVYPGVILVLSLTLTIFISIYVLPKITPIFKNMSLDLPIWTKIIIGFSAFMTKYWLASLAGLVFVIIVLIGLRKLKFLRSLRHRLILIMPVINHISRGANLASGFRTLGVLLKSGFAVDEALTATSRSVSNYYYQAAFLNISAAAVAGQSVGDSLETAAHLFPPTTRGIIRVGERTGNLAEQCLFLATYYEAETDKTIKNLTTLFEPALLIIVGALVGIFALGIITPIYQISGNLKY